jgi:cobaltochelatase CobN
MHLLLAQKGTIAEGEDAVDLGQSPGRIAVFSAADTEIAVLAAARAGRGDGPDFLRLVNLLQLKHPMSVDQWIERTGRHAKLIVVRILGGESYWPYGLEALHAAAVNHGIKLAVLPGDDKPDPVLDRFCTIEPEHCQALWAYLTEGGLENATLFLQYADFVIKGGSAPATASPLLKAGLIVEGQGQPTLETVRANWIPGAPVVAIVFYRALLQSGQTQAIGHLRDALQQRGGNVAAIYVSGLKDAVSAATVQQLFDEISPSIVLNATGFAISPVGKDWQGTVLDRGGAPVLQVVLSSSTEEAWAASAQGLTSRDLAMNIALPELDGRVLSRAISFKAAAQFDAFVEANIVAHKPLQDRVDFVADLATNWIRLRQEKSGARRVAIVLANYPNKDGRIANGVGLDTPAGTIEVLNGMRNSGYNVGSIPADGDALLRELQAGVTNQSGPNKAVSEVISLHEYNGLFDKLPVQIQNQVRSRWGDPKSDPFYDLNRAGFALPLKRYGHVMVGIQPARGYNIDPKQSYHSPDLVPPHGYFAFYFYLRKVFEVHAIIHMGKHGNMEWLPGKALGLSEACYPEATFGPTPHIYPFIVNDPGEGTQAKRRSSAVIIDHLTPPLTRAENYGALKDLEALVDEYYQAMGSDPRRVKLLGPRILELVHDMGLDHDAGIAKDEAQDSSLEKLDAFLCDLKEMQIRDGLHIFGKAPEGRLLTDLVVALARLPRRDGLGRNASLHRAIADDLALGFDPLDCAMAQSWDGVKPDVLAVLVDDDWRTNGDSVERIELLAAKLVGGEMDCPEAWVATRTVLSEIEEKLRPSVTACGDAEIDNLLKALDGRFVPPGPSGAPTRGRPDVLPTGKNFYSVDCRAVPTETAWELGKKSAELLCERHLQDHGEHLSSVGITAWGTSNMRTGGDDIAQALALIGVKPVWERASGRVTGYEIIPLAVLARPRVDVTLRISGFFRDAFPEQIALFDAAVRAVAKLDEEAGENPIAERVRNDAAMLLERGCSAAEAQLRAGYRVFGSMPGAYGAGLQALIDEKGWTNRSDLAEAYLVWGSYAYGANADGVADRAGFEARLSGLQAVVQNQDNREHDLLDSDDYYQFEGGMTAAVEQLKGHMPTVYHNDHSRPEKPVIRTLEEEISRVVRARVVNPKWIAGVMRHGYKGAFEMAATLDYMFAFSATTGAVKSHHFELAHQAYIANDAVRNFMEQSNPAALREMAARFLEAMERGLWTPRSNSAKFDLERIVSTRH